MRRDGVAESDCLCGGVGLEERELFGGGGQEVEEIDQRGGVERVGVSWGEVVDAVWEWGGGLERTDRFLGGREDGEEAEDDGIKGITGKGEAISHQHYQSAVSMYMEVKEGVYKRSSLLLGP